MMNVVLYREEDGSVPLLDWLERLPQKTRLACLGRIELLRSFGHALRRPHSEYLRDGIYELRTRVKSVQYRMLYFFHGQQVIVLTYGIIKQQAAVPAIEIERAVRRKRAFEAAPMRHTHREV